MRAWSVLRQLLAATLCAVLVAPAYPSESTLPRSSTTPSHIYDAATLSKTRVWGSNEKILLHFRATLLLSEKQHWGCANCSSRIVVGSGVTYDYDAFGNLLHSTGTTFNEFLFAGEQFDSDLGLYYNRARYLNVSTGRFWTMDTYEGDPQSPRSLHKYVYAENDPVDQVDPSGHQIVDILLAVAVAVVILALPSSIFTPGPENKLDYTKLLDDPARHILAIQWKLASNSMHGGWIVQHITLNIPGGRNYDFWEAWQVLLNSRGTTTFSVVGYDDLFGGPNGTAINAEARFYEGVQLPPSFAPGFMNPDTAPAGQLAATAVDPNLPIYKATPPVDRVWVAPWTTF